MADKSTSTAHDSRRVRRGGPFLSGGNYYAVAHGPNTTDRFTILKASNPVAASPWSEQDASNRPTFNGTYVEYAGCRVDGTNIHIVTAWLDTSDSKDDAYNFEYHVFSMSSDTWTTTNEAIDTNIGGKFGTTGFYIRPDLRIRSDGTVVAFLPTRIKDMGAFANYCAYYIRSSGGTWGSLVAVHSGLGFNQWPNAIALGTSDRCHFLYQGNPNRRLRTQTLNSSDSLSSTSRIPDSTDISDCGTTFRPCAIGQDDEVILSGVVWFSYEHADGDPQSCFFTSADDPSSFTLNEISTDFTDAQNMGLCTDGTDVYLLMRNSTDSEVSYFIYTTSWGSQLQFDTDGDLRPKGVTILNRASENRLAMVGYDASLDFTYADLGLGAPPAPTGPPIGGLALVGVGR